MSHQYVVLCKAGARRRGHIITEESIYIIGSFHFRVLLTLLHFRMCHF